jgi:peptidoglycan/LPS O-acetylase OafA/YrhL
LAGLVAIVASVCALANAMWAPVLFHSMLTGMPQGDRGIGYTYVAFFGGGLLGVLAVALAEQRTRAARIVLAVAGLLLVSAPFAYKRLHRLPVATTIVLGLAMLAAAPFIGPMPAPRRLACLRADRAHRILEAERKATLSRIAGGLVRNALERPRRLEQRRDVEWNALYS